MAAITTTIDIERRAEAVFAYASDPARVHEWRQRGVDGTMDTEDEPQVGEGCLTTRRIGFAERPVTAELVHIDPPRTWGVRGVDGPIRAAADVTLEPLAEACRG